MLLPAKPKAQEYTYLDHNASAPIHPAVLRAMIEAAAFVGNPSALHQPGQQLKHILSRARTTIKNFIGAHNAQLIFTSGATESNYLILRSHNWNNVILSPFEHPSIYKNTQHTTCAINKDGFVDVKDLQQTLQNNQEKQNLISIQMANSESGLILNIHEVVRVARAQGAYIHSDATQAFGRIPIDFSALDLDAMTIAAHKSGGPKGIGALIIKDTSLLSHSIKGGGQEFGLRAGTENTLGIVGFAELCQHIDWQHNHSLHTWHQALEQTLYKICPQSIILPSHLPRLPNTSLLHMPNTPAMTQTIHFDLKNIAIGSGFSCSSGTPEGISFLRSIKTPHNTFSESIRVSSGWNTTQQDLLNFTHAWLQLFHGT